MSDTNDNKQNMNDDVYKNAIKIDERVCPVFTISIGKHEYNGLSPKRLAKRLQKILDTFQSDNVSYDVDYISAESYGHVCEEINESYTYANQINGSLETVINGSTDYGTEARKLCDGFMNEYDAFKRTHPDDSANDAISRADRIVILRRTYQTFDDSRVAVSFAIKTFEIARTASAEKRMSEANAITAGIKSAFGINGNDENMNISVTIDGAVHRSPLSFLRNTVSSHIDSDHDVLRLVAIGTGIGAIASAIVGSSGVLAWFVVSAMFWVAYHLGDFGGDGLVLDMIFKLDSVGLLAAQPRVTLRYSHTMLYVLLFAIVIALLYPLLV